VRRSVRQVHEAAATGEQEAQADGEARRLARGRVALDSAAPDERDAHDGQSDGDDHVGDPDEVGGAVGQGPPSRTALPAVDGERGQEREGHEAHAREVRGVLAEDAAERGEAASMAARTAPSAGPRADAAALLRGHSGNNGNSSHTSDRANVGRRGAQGCPAVTDQAEDAGLDPARVRELLERCRREVDAGLLPSCQLAIAREGRLGTFATFGDATPRTRYVMFSCTKPVVASAIWLLIGDGALDTSVKVGDLIPEFATNGKDVVTVEQVLLHTSGFPHAPLGPPEWFTREGRRARFAQWRLNWEPGSRYEYHATSAHWVLAEIIHAVTGVDHRDFIRSRVSEPLGLRDLFVGMPEDEHADVAEIVTCGEPCDPDELEKLIGVREFPRYEVTDEHLVRLNDRATRALGVPGAGGITTAADLALFYQALLHNSGGLWDADVLRDATGNVRNTFVDPLRGMPANRTLGLMVAGDDGKADLRGFGATVSARAFGHDGAGGQIAFADPATGLSFAYVTNGLDANLIREWRRVKGIASRAALCAPA
jgi:CubicO group peptidase (beta-lactamase class C family)